VRQRIALALCVLWLVGFELMPWLHVALHDQLVPHTHDASGAVVLTEDAPHEHVHTHVYPRPPQAHHHHHGADDLTRLADRLAHGAHALEHHGIAVPVPGPVWLTPLPVDRKPTHLEVVAIARLVSLELARAVARGPPSIAA
jgi:hypothetical protein